MKRFFVASAAGLLVLAAGFAVQAQDDGGRRRQRSEAVSEADDAGSMPVSDPICTFFGPDHDKWVAALQDTSALSHLTEDVVSQLAPVGKLATASFPSAPGGSRTDTIQNPALPTIDKYIFEKMAQQGVAPAPMTTDYEYIRRVTLDLTGRIPTPTEVVNFVNDPATDKRARLVNTLLGTQQWVDKWTVWLADLYHNNATNDIGASRFQAGVAAFNEYIRRSLQTNKPYNVMAKEMIAGTGDNSYSFDQGYLNFLVGGVMGGGPIQDVFDQQTAIVTEKFLGLAHVNCLLCHSGRGHLDSLSLWGYYKTRNDAYGMASFMSRTATMRIPVDPANLNIYYWTSVNNIAVGTVVQGVRNGTNYTIDYALNTQTGNRPARGATNSTVRVRPAYIMNGASPAAGSDYRAFLADQITSDFQFARATVNYVWEYFFEIGLVTPSNQMDPARLDPDNPPADCPLPTTPCTLQASHPRLLNELAQNFINSGYSLRELMREIVTSRAYQLSSRYEGTWNPTNDRLFARKLVRRLWSEEVHDAVVQSSGVPVTYTNAAWNPSTVNWAMQLPEPTVAAGNATTFLNAFLRGNRDSEPRRGDVAIGQTLALMNDAFIFTNRVNVNVTTFPNSLIAQVLRMTDTDGVNLMFLSVLSRYPTTDEQTAALNNLRVAGNTAAKTQEYRNLLWSLYNKVDFVFNY